MKMGRVAEGHNEEGGHGREETIRDAWSTLYCGATEPLAGEASRLEPKAGFSDERVDAPGTIEGAPAEVGTAVAWPAVDEVEVVADFFSWPRRRGRGEWGRRVERGGLVSGTSERATRARGTDVGNPTGLVVDVGDLFRGRRVEVKDLLAERRPERLLVVVAGGRRDAALLVDLLGLADNLLDDRVGHLKHLGRDGLLRAGELLTRLVVERVEEREEARRDALLAVGLDGPLDNGVREVVAVGEELSNDTGLGQGRVQGSAAAV